MDISDAFLIDISYYYTVCTVNMTFKTLFSLIFQIQGLTNRYIRLHWLFLIAFQIIWRSNGYFRFYDAFLLVFQILRPSNGYFRVYGSFLLIFQILRLYNGYFRVYGSFLVIFQILRLSDRDAALCCKLKPWPSRGQYFSFEKQGNILQPWN